MLVPDHHALSFHGLHVGCRGTIKLVVFGHILVSSDVSFLEHESQDSVSCQSLEVHHEVQISQRVNRVQLGVLLGLRLIFCFGIQRWVSCAKRQHSYFFGFLQDELGMQVSVHRRAVGYYTSINQSFIDMVLV